jgi:hypothetical protein
MKEKALFEYAVLRLVPIVEREEFINVGVILFCKRLNFLNMLYQPYADDCKRFNNNVDAVLIQSYLNVYQKICDGNPEGGPIALLSIAERFRWITATKSTIIQTSRVHTGLCEKPDNQLIKIFAEMVL